MNNIRWTDKVWLDSDGNIQSFESPICVGSTDYTEKIVKSINDDIDNQLVMEVSKQIQMDIDKPRLIAVLNNDENYYLKYWTGGYNECERNYSFIKDENVKLKEDMKLIKDAINDPNKNGFDICRLIKNVTDEYNFEEVKDENTNL